MRKPLRVTLKMRYNKAIATNKGANQMQTEATANRYLAETAIRMHQLSPTAGELRRAAERKAAKRNWFARLFNI